MTFAHYVADLVNLILDNWLISLVALAVFASVCLGLFKGIKHGIRALIALTVLIALAACGLLVYSYISKDLMGLIKFAIAWLPTILFMLIVLISTLVGISRGLRKSLILLLQAAISGGISLGLYFFFIKSQTFDKFLLDTVNAFMGTGGIQSALGVPSDCATMREVLVCLFDNYAVDMGEFGILLQSNSAYVMTIIDMAYRIAFAVVCYLIYLLLVFISYILYVCFYSERKYRRKKNAAFSRRESDRSYHRRPIGGGCVGLFRGMATGLISISFLGSIFFIAAGGYGASKLPDVSFGDDYNGAVSIYRSVEDYGAQGIFKVLNAVRDPEDTPYYLFIADIVFSGGLDDSYHNVSANVKFREELAAYLGFAKNTLGLLTKYDADGEIEKMLGGNVGEDAMDKVLAIALKPEFRAEFDNLVDNFDTQTYIINFALSLADSVIANIDSFSFTSELSEENKDLLKIMFMRGYLSDSIPDERELKATSTQLTEEQIHPYITINHLFTKKDAQTVLGIVLSFLAGDINTEDPLSMARVLVPYVEQLSIFNSERSGEMDPVLGRLYCYFDNKYLTDEGKDGLSYAEIKDEKVSWSREIRSILKVSPGIFDIYDRISGAEEGNLLEIVTDMFDEEDENYAETVKNYEELTEVISDSALMSRVLNSGKMSELLRTKLAEGIEGFYLPEKIVYENRYDAEGNLLSHGEAYYILRGLRFLADKENRSVIDKISGVENDFKELLDELSGIITREDPYAEGNTLSVYLTESVLLRSALSSVILSRAGDMLVVPALSLETEDAAEGKRTVNLINKAELKEIFDALPKLVDLILPLAEEELTAEDVNKILNDETFNSLLDNGNKIVEGTISKAVIEMLEGNDRVVLAKKLENYEEWITVGSKGELRKFLDAIKSLDLDIGAIIDGGGLDASKIYDTVKSLGGDDIDALLDSAVFYYTASNMLDRGEFGIDDFEMIVPDSSFELLEDDTIERLIRRDELSSVFIELANLDLNSDLGQEEIIRKLAEKKEVLDRSKIISASVVNFIVTHDDVCSSLNVPKLYMDAGSAESLKNYDSTNVWHRELPNMITAIDEIFDISDPSFSFDGDAVTDRTNELLKSLNEPSRSLPESGKTRLEVCYASDILKNNITTELDKALDGVVDENVISEAKTDGYYNESELRALSETASIFDLDILGLDNGELSSKVKDEIITIDIPRADDKAGRSALDIMYPSAIIRYFMTEEIDKALNGEAQTDETLIEISVRDSFKDAQSRYPKAEVAALVSALRAVDINDINAVNADKFSSVSTYSEKIEEICVSNIATGIISKQIDKSLTDDVIDAGVKKAIKGRNGCYSSTEIVALTKALTELDMQEFTDFEGENFADDVKNKINSLKNPAESDPTCTKLDVVYRSDIFAGVFTKSVKDTFNNPENGLVYHKSADRSDLAVLKKEEINALVSLLGSENLDNFNVGSLSIAAVRDSLRPDADSRPRSYLISANFTASLLKNGSVYVPSNVYSGGLIDAFEAVNFINALEILQSGNGSVDGWTVEGDMVTPDASSRETILKSEIMRATFSHYVLSNESNTNIIFRRTNVQTGFDRVVSGDVAGKGVFAGKIPLISSDQLTKLFEVIDRYMVDGALVIPSFNTVEDVKKLDAQLVELMYSFDVTRYNISRVIQSDSELKLILMLYPQYTEKENSYKFNGADSWQESEETVVTLDAIKQLTGIK